MVKKRNTKQKEILIEYLRDNCNKHLNINEIYKELKGNVGMTTIYRNINELIDEGVVTKIPCENTQGFCYKYDDRQKECHSHYHLICEKCNKLFHFESNEINKLNNEVMEKNNFEIDQDRIMFYGICKECHKIK